MILDVIVLAILTIPAAIGLYRGFAHAFLHTLGWIGALMGGLVLTGAVSRVLQDGFLADIILERLLDKFMQSAAALESAFEGLPQIISGGLTITEEESVEIFAEMLTSILVTIIAFLLGFFFIRAALGVLVRSTTKRERVSLLKGANKLLGLVAGLIEGVILVFVFLALLLPFADLADEAASAAIVQWLDSSAIAGTLYDNNLLLLMTGGFFS